MLNTLSHTLLVRPGSSSGGVSTTARTSADFQIDGQSLLRILVRAHGGHDDFMGALVQGVPEARRDVAGQLMLHIAPSSGSGRVLLYICPECGDIGCGAFSARIARDGGTYAWSDFAYENDHEDPCPLQTVGPFVFGAVQYEAAIVSAAAI